METIYYVVIIACLGYILANRIFNQYSMTRYKPFDCPACLAFWLTIIAGVLFQKELIIFAPVTFIIAAILDKYV